MTEPSATLINKEEDESSRQRVIAGKKVVARGANCTVFTNNLKR